MEIKGKLITLRDWKLSDLETYRKWQIGSHDWKKWDAPYFEKKDSEVDSMIEKIKSRIQNQDFSSPRSGLVMADTHSSELIGTVGSYWISQETNWLALGLVIFDPNYWQGGRGREALTLWIDYQFETRPEIPRVDLQTWSGNHRMMNLAEKLGFQLEGRFRKARFYQGQHYDSVQYGILREEWKSQSGRVRT